VRTIAFGFEQATAFQDKHSNHQEEKENANPVDIFFHKK
jgi:hypothetical protein